MAVYPCPRIGFRFALPLLVMGLLLSLASITAGTDRGAPSTVPGGGGLGLELVVGGLVEPLYVTHTGNDRLFVVEKGGRIRIVRQTGSGNWSIKHGSFLNIRDRVGDDGSEQGLLGLAFHPDYDSNGLFYVNYTRGNGDTVISEFRRRRGAKADKNSERQLLKIRQPFQNHNGGWLGFKGPFMYIALGDGGSGGDPGNRAQDINNRLGKILRINPLDPDGNGPAKYTIPDGNPFVGRNGNDLVWTYGLRNPWRNSFDRVTGEFWIADVGQDRYEEISRVESGYQTNLGWRLLEGEHRYPSGSVCQSDCKTLPMVDYYSGGSSDDCSVTGGYVARRSGADLYGRYIFGDFCSGRIWSISTNQGLNDPLPSPYNSGRLISSFGEAADGRIYLTDLTGSLWRVTGS